MARSRDLTGKGRFQTSIQISPDARDYLFALQRILGISRTDVIEQAVRQLAQKYLPADELAALLDPPALDPLVPAATNSR
jgi:hypothetical protein